MKIYKEQNYDINKINNKEDKNVVADGIEDVRNAQIKSSEEGIKKSQNLNNKQSYSLDVKEITKIYQNKIHLFNLCFRKNRKITLNGLTFTVEGGECFGFIGANGAGKSTTFKCLCKEEKPDNGIIKINNYYIFDYSSKNKFSIGYCLQFDSVFEYLTVEQNLHFYCQLKGVRKLNLRFINRAIMKTLDITEFRDYKCKNLSGGNKRKVSVGISIICHPNVIFMDEPSTGKDPYARRLLLNLLHKSYLKNEDKNNKKKVSTKSYYINNTFYRRC